MSGKSAPLDVARFKIAVRIEWDGIQAASRWGDAAPEAEEAPRFERGGYDPEFARIVSESGVQGTPTPTPRFLRGWLAADYLGWIHSASKRLCAAPALRIAVGHASDNGLWSLGDYGYRFEEKNGAVIATHELGEGLWPDDFRAFDRLKNLDLSAYTSAALTLAPAARAYAASEDYVTFLGVNDLSPLGGAGPMLRFLGAAHPTDAQRLLDRAPTSSRQLEAAQMQPGTIRAMERLCTESDLSFVLEPPDSRRFLIQVWGTSKSGRRFFFKDGIWESLGVDLPVGDAEPPNVELRIGAEVKTATHVQSMFAFEGRGNWGDRPDRMRTGPLRYTVSNGPQRPLTTKEPGD
ncbi:hypothetical protein EON79_20215 [bacterium]|nr:MAG: hypothetical protein EON79_20215 [bacterium]